MTIPESKSFEILEHTADVGVIAHGATIAETFAHTAQGMYAIMVDPETVREREIREIRVTADAPEDLLVAWLLELLFLTESEGLLFRRFEIDVADGTTLVAHAIGERLDLARHRTETAIKAVTHYQLKVERDHDGYHVRVIFDI